MPKFIPGRGQNAHRFVISLCDYSGNWPRPFAEQYGYSVLHYDLKHGDDVTKLSAAGVWLDMSTHRRDDSNITSEVAVVLAAPPCTDFTVSGAQYWPAKDADGRTAASLAVVDACLRLVSDLDPTLGWMLENPVGRLPKLRPVELGKPLIYVDPCDFAELATDPQQDSYTKRTGLWGRFDETLLKALRDEYRIEPIRVCAQGSWVQKLGGKSERTKELRSMTPEGLARACAATLIRHPHAVRLAKVSK